MNLLTCLIAQCFINIISRVILVVLYQISIPHQPWIIFGICGIVIRFLSTGIVPAVDIIDGRTLDITWYKKINFINHLINLVMEPLFIYMYMQIPCFIKQCGDSETNLMMVYAIMIILSTMMDIIYGNMINKKFVQ